MTRKNLRTMDFDLYRYFNGLKCAVKEWNMTDKHTPGQSAGKIDNLNISLYSVILWIFIYSEVYFGINVAIDEDVLSKLKYFRHLYTLCPIHPTICVQVNTDTESMNLIVCTY